MRDIKISETEWALEVVGIINEKLKEEFPNQLLFAEAGKSLLYANEVYEYTSEGDGKIEKMGFRTDILIFEKFLNGTWKPRVVIETKIRGVTTHDAITYSKKAANHKAVHPYLRYGIFIGEIDHIPGRLFRHGENFDFMVTWAGPTPSDEERDDLIEVIKQEVEASRQLDHIMYGTRNKERAKFTLLHRPLVLKAEQQPSSAQ